ncbi:hypothetical protein DM02DRAFT_608278 [Periconia macrospinosa]|uniref:U three protein 23 n=1 Tax=Periconia macrospinosa TaxID=97972 RepID=A0A2V1EDK2_9PLEO|nr:hypothetical protein DM02DRAFT_608278 [Periconia macrospinosa]
MKLRRAKAYRKLMHQYQIQFGFREPYQVLLDSAILEDAYRTKIDIVSRLRTVLQGEIKPMITQCSMRHLYKATPKNNALIDQAKTYERRRCNHHELEEPLSDLECLKEVVDPKGSMTNKHRYVVASQDEKVRKHMRRIAGVPVIYISKSVMLLEPMGTSSEEARNREEKSKFRLGLKGARNPDAGQKRKRDSNEEGQDDIAEEKSTDARPQKKKKKQHGPKQPNPLSVKKSKKAETPKNATPRTPETSEPQTTVTEDAEGGAAGTTRKRKRKHKPKGDSGAMAAAEEVTTES